MKATLLLLLAISTTGCSTLQGLACRFIVECHEAPDEPTYLPTPDEDYDL